jgi:hypothetical protein
MVCMDSTDEVLDTDYQKHEKDRRRPQMADGG